MDRHFDIQVTQTKSDHLSLSHIQCQSIIGPSAVSEMVSNVNNMSSHGNHKSYIHDASTAQ